jgi:transcriptional regulator GlxA family with amidase domain
MQLAIAVFPKMTTLDALGPYQVFSGLPDADVVLCAAERGRVTDDVGGVRLDIEHTFDDIPRPDVLLVPGGNVTRRMARDGDPVVAWIRSAHDHTVLTTSVCTGALLLGAAGLLRGVRATTHWVAHEELRRYGAEPVDERVVFDGKIVTGAGVSAGLDLALHVAARLAGPEVAQSIQLMLEYDPQPPFEAGSFAKAPQSVKDSQAKLIASWR